MFLKISDGNGDWVLFDKVDRVQLGAQRKLVKKAEDLHSYQEEGLINLISKDCFPRTNPLDVGLIEFHRDGVRNVALFASVAYILNDEGMTIEKISAQQRNSRNGKD